MLALTHLYDFNVNANDQVGTAHATLFNGAQLSSGRLVMQNAGITSGQTSLVQYAKLPNGVLPTSGSATVEVWYNTFSATPNWMRVFDFGDQTGANGNSFLFYSPKGSGGDARATLRPAGSTERTASATTRYNHGYQHMAAVVVDATAGMLSLYIDGVFKSSTALNGATIASINESNAFLGRSQFNVDSGFSGAIDELRIYNDARTAIDIAADYATGTTRPAPVSITRRMENLDRGLVAMNQGNGQIYVGWRLLGTDAANVEFNLYRVTGNGAPSKRNGTPISTSTNFVDTGADTKQVIRYYVRPVINGVEQSPSESVTLGANPLSLPYQSIPMQIPPNGVTRDGVPYHYTIHDTSVGDLDGDGKYEFVVKWESVNDGVSEFYGDWIFDAYEMDGTRLWRINLGKNVSDLNDGYLVYDLDRDGKAEVIMRTADGTTDGLGVVIGNPNADWVNTTQYPVGWTVRGPQFLTVFSGETGAARATVPFEPAQGNLTDWGDDYGQRAHQIFGTIAYLDGVYPSMVWVRGIYGARSPYAQQTQMVAYDFLNGQITKKWHFKAGLKINNDINSNFTSQGNHQVSVADVDQDGKDEILNGSMVVDNNGLPLVSSENEHGDAMHVSDLDPSRPGLEVFGIHENEGTYDPNRPPGAALYDPLTGVTRWGAGRGIDVGRGNAADVDPTRPGAENWGGPPVDNPQGAGVIRDVNGNTITDVNGTPLAVPNTNNFLLWWDGDLTRELLDRTYINKWNWTTGGTDRLLTANGVATSQSTKSFPALTGDLLGDWREEVVWKTGDSSALRIYTTTIPATNRIFTLMHDSQYRVATVWQNNAYNQPPHPSFFIGAGMATPAMPNITTAAAVVVAPSAPVNLAANVLSPTEIHLSWNAVPGSTGFRVKRSDDAGGNFFTLVNNFTNTTFIDTTAKAGGEYYYIVTALNGIIESANSAEVFASSALPAPWLAQDVGAVTGAGRSSYADGIFTVRGSGAASNDGLRMVSQNLTGDHELVVRVDGKSNNIGYGGLMFRASTSSSSAYAAIWAAPTDQNRIFFQYRQTSGGGTTYSVAYNAVPVWLKITRVGDTYTGFWGTDGVNWTQVGTRTITLGTTIPAGLVVSGSSASPTTADFSNLLVIPTTNATPKLVQGAHFWQPVPDRLRVIFSENIGATLDAGDVTIAKLGVTEPPVPIGNFSFDPTINAATMTLPAGLSDGNYRLTLNSANITDPAGAALSGVNTYDFFILTGDANHDRNVNTMDFAALAANFNRTGMAPAQGDFNDDGKVNALDFNALATYFGQTVPLVPPAPLANDGMGVPLSGAGFSAAVVSPGVFSTTRVDDDEAMNDVLG